MLIAKLYIRKQITQIDSDGTFANIHRRLVF